jgi:hypothetical protein
MNSSIAEQCPIKTKVESFLPDCIMQVGNFSSSIYKIKGALAEWIICAGVKYRRAGFNSPGRHKKKVYAGSCNEITLLLLHQ